MKTVKLTEEELLIIRLALQSFNRLNSDEVKLHLREKLENLALQERSNE